MEYWQTGVIFVEWIEFVIYISLDDLQDKPIYSFIYFKKFVWTPLQDILFASTDFLRFCVQLFYIAFYFF